MLEYIVSGPVVVSLLTFGALLVAAFLPDASSCIVYLLPLGVFSCLLIMAYPPPEKVPDFRRPLK